MMEAASTSETLVDFYQTTRHNPEHSHLKNVFSTLEGDKGIKLRGPQKTADILIS
jgi:hypothetical protein